MTPKDVWTGKLKIGDRVRVTATKEEYTVTDLFSAAIDGSRLTVVMGRDRWTDVSQVEKVEEDG